MEGDLNFKLKIHAQTIADLWREQCSLHTELFELRCDEYMHLLASDLEKLDLAIEEKSLLIDKINQLEDRRKLCLQEVNLLRNGQASIQKLGELLLYLNEQGLNNESDRIEKLNLVLLDIVEKIQEQNKKNQVFLNKALLSLKELKNSFGGGKTYETYGSNGVARNSMA